MGDQSSRIFIVDPHPMIRRGLKKQLSCASHVRVAGEAPSAEQALGRLEETPADVVLTNIRLDDTSGLELTRRLKDKDSGVAVLIVTAYDDMIGRARQAGADGYLLHEWVYEQLLEAIDAVASGRSYFPPP